MAVGHATCLVLKTYVVAGRPKKLLLDRGAGFSVNKMIRFLKNDNMHQLFASLHDPQCNGMNERTRSYSLIVAVTKIC